MEDSLEAMVDNIEEIRKQVESKPIEERVLRLERYLEEQIIASFANKACHDTTNLRLEMLEEKVFKDEK